MVGSLRAVTGQRGSRVSGFHVIRYSCIARTRTAVWVSLSDSLGGEHPRMLLLSQGVGFPPFLGT